MEQLVSGLIAIAFVALLSFLIIQRISKGPQFYESQMAAVILLLLIFVLIVVPIAYLMLRQYPTPLKAAGILLTK